MTHMLREIFEQPESIRGVIGRVEAGVEKLVREIRRRDIKFVYIAARGSSDHAAVYAKYVLEIQHGLPVALASPSAFTLYDQAAQFGEQCLVLGISQSGAGPDVVEVVRRSRCDGALTACIVNTPNSTLAAVTEFPLHLGLGRERSVAATKTYTSTLAVVALLSCALSKSPQTAHEELDCAVTGIESALELDDSVASVAERYAEMRECVVLARGFNQPTALETALKLMETCYVGARAYSGADFEHGPVAQLSLETPCILFAPSGNTLASMMALANTVALRTDHLIGISDSSEMLSLCSTPIRIARPVAEWVSPLVNIIPAQLFACRLSSLRRINPDEPRGLSKVTMTI